MVARSITNSLTSPSKVAQSLDWKMASGSILSLRIVKDQIELAVSSHPSFDEEVQALPSIPLELKTVNNRKVLCGTVADSLLDVVNQFHVCGMVVSWPVQKEGWCGAPCGRVLHTLDQISMTVDRPVCLYDPVHSTPPEDDWGRASIYSETTKKTVHVASQEHYNQDCTDGKVATDIWNDFCMEHWPEFSQDSHSRTEANTSTGYHDSSWLEDRSYNNQEVAL